MIFIYVLIQYVSELYENINKMSPYTLKSHYVVRWSDYQRELWTLEFTISYKTAAENAWLWKQAKAHDLVNAGCETEYHTKLIALKTASRVWLLQRIRLQCNCPQNIKKRYRQICNISHLHHTAAVFRILMHKESPTTIICRHEKLYLCV